jgi:2-(1,2-epoxy-1,2-dihydrophenyl)acetyl-CoA isomerase
VTPVSKLVEYSVEQKVARITLNNPKANALNIGLTKGLLEALQKSEQDPGVRVRVITGSGRYFCAGLDLKSVDIGLVAEMMEKYLNPIVIHLIGETKPTICAVNGPAVGAGASIVLGTDFAYIAEKAYLMFPFIRIGLIPDGLSTFTLPRIVGYKKAMEIFVSGERINSKQTRSLGICDAVCAETKIQQTAFEKAVELAGLDHDALKLTKRTLNASVRHIAEQAGLELKFQTELLGAEIFRQTVERFKTTY